MTTLHFAPTSGHQAAAQMRHGALAFYGQAQTLRPSSPRAYDGTVRLWGVR